MLQNAYFLAKIGADTAENEQHFAEILPIDRRVAARAPGASAVGAAEAAGAWSPPRESRRGEESAAPVAT